MHVIWQYGKRGEANQTVLTIGGTQLETNYRVRVVSNTSELDRSLSESVLGKNWTGAVAKLTLNSLEIRKLQLTDSGWYECQLPTKPTQINYVFLEVLSAYYITLWMSIGNSNKKPGNPNNNFFFCFFGKPNKKSRESK
jgi:hypothetical protein